MSEAERNIGSRFESWLGCKMKILSGKVFGLRTIKTKGEEENFT